MAMSYSFPNAMPLFDRRAVLRAGSLSVLGLSLGSLLQAEESQGGAGRKRRAAKSCILFFMEGGPAHQDTFDLKPEAPPEIRGEFRPIATTVPGMQVCEHLPMLAQQMHLLAQVRSMHHTVVDHNAGAYYALTGRPPMEGGQLIVSERGTNFPPFGAVLARLRPLENLPEFVQIPEVLSNNGYDLPGQRAGFLGESCNPLFANDPSAPDYQVRELSLPAGISTERLEQRRQLRTLLERAQSTSGVSDRFAADSHYDKAFSLLTSPAASRAFDLSLEPRQVRERYGLADRTDRSKMAREFGGLPHLGQSMLLARRLVEAGVRLVTVASGRRLCQAWDTHRDHFPLLKQSLLPYADRALSALLADLHERRMLDDTLVVAMGEFGRTPKLGQITSSAGAAANGRDHWPHCYTVLLAGGGIRGGAVHGASDAQAAYPKRDPATPEDIAATIYHALGLDPETRITNPLGIPQPLALGSPILPLFG